MMSIRMLAESLGDGKWDVLSAQGRGGERRGKLSPWG